MKLLFSESMASTTQKRVKIEAGMYKGLMLVYYGTNNSGQVGTKDNVGTVTPYLNGKAKDVFTPARQWEVNYRCARGVNRFTSTDNSHYTFAVEMPFHLDDGNVAHFGENELTLEFNYSNPTATVFSALTLQVWAIEGHGTERYLLMPFDASLKTISQRTQLQKIEGFSNIARLAFVYHANHTDLLVQKNGNWLRDVSVGSGNLTMAAITAHAECLNNTFAAWAALAPLVFEFFTPGNLRQCLGNDYRVGAISTTTDVTVFGQRLILREEKTRLTSQLMQEFAKRRMAENPDMSAVALL